jgi:hypothetical protein
VCCCKCFETAVDFSIKLNCSSVPCPISGCNSNFSEETIEENLLAGIYKKLFSLSSPSEMKKIKEALIEKDELIKNKYEVIKKNE